MSTKDIPTEGPTAYPKARGIWRDDDRDGTLIKDEPVLVHCYLTPSDLEDMADSLHVAPLQVAALLLERTVRGIRDEEISEIREAAARYRSR